MENKSPAFLMNCPYIKIESLQSFKISYFTPLYSIGSFSFIIFFIRIASLYLFNLIQFEVL